MKKFSWRKAIKYSILWCFGLVASLYVFLPSTLQIVPAQVPTTIADDSPLSQSQLVNSVLFTMHEANEMVMEGYDELNVYIKALQSSKAGVYQHKILVEDLDLEPFNRLQLPGDNVALTAEYYGQLITLDLLGKDLVFGQIQSESPDLLLRDAKDLAKRMKAFLDLHKTVSRAVTQYASQLAAANLGSTKTEVVEAFKYMLEVDKLLTQLQKADRVKNVNLAEVKKVRAQMKLHYEALFKSNLEPDLQYAQLYIALQKLQLLSERLISDLDKGRLGNQQYLFRAQELLETYNLAVEEYNQLL